MFFFFFFFLFLFLPPLNLQLEVGNFGVHGVRSVAPLEALVAALPANRLVVVVGIDVREQASRDGMPSAEDQPGVPTGSRPVRSPNGWVTLTVTGNGGSCGASS